jgi:hypothetical protein
MTAIATLLAVRILLLLSGIGGFTLAYIAIQNPDSGRLLVCGIYNVLLFLPLIWLYVTRG